VEDYGGLTLSLRIIAFVCDQLSDLKDWLKIRSGILHFRNAVLYCPPTTWLLCRSAPPFRCAASGW